MKGMVRDVREGWRFIFANPVVRAVNIGLAAGLLPYLAFPDSLQAETVSRFSLALSRW